MSSLNQFNITISPLRGLRNTNLSKSDFIPQKGEIVNIFMKIVLMVHILVFGLV